MPCCVALLALIVLVQGAAANPALAQSNALSGPLAPATSSPRPSSAPGVLPDASARERMLALHMQSIATERELLDQAGRPEHYWRRRIGGFVGIGIAGAAVVTALTVLFAADGLPGPHSGEPEEASRAARITLPLGIIVGSLIGPVSIWFVATANRGHLYGDRIAALTNEHDLLQQALREARRQRRLDERRRKRDERYSFGLTARGGNHGLSLIVKM